MEVKISKKKAIELLANAKGVEVITFQGGAPSHRMAGIRLPKVVNSVGIQFFYPDASEGSWLRYADIEAANITLENDTDLNIGWATYRIYN